MNWRENLPAIKFLAIFLGVYLLGNLLYGIYIESNYPYADHITRVVSSQATWVINLFVGENAKSVLCEASPVTLILENGKMILRVYEGCNGINVMIVFVAFLFAFQGLSRRGSVFILIGLMIIHLVNLLRIVLLFLVAKEYQIYFYYVHKYIFTAILYVIVLLLWWVWVKAILKRRAN
jgi:exosortase family protein XrtF